MDSSRRRLRLHHAYTRGHVWVCITPVHTHRHRPLGRDDTRRTGGGAGGWACIVLERVAIEVDHSGWRRVVVQAPEAPFGGVCIYHPGQRQPIQRVHHASRAAPQVHRHLRRPHPSRTSYQHHQHTQIRKEARITTIRRNIKVGEAS